MDFRYSRLVYKIPLGSHLEYSHEFSEIQHTSQRKVEKIVHHFAVEPKHASRDPIQRPGPGCTKSG